MRMTERRADNAKSVVELAKGATEKEDPTKGATEKEDPAGAATDAVEHPAHYAGTGIECMDAMASMMGAVAGDVPPIAAYWWGNAFKYLWRWRKKNGREDLEKARQCIAYLLDEIGEEEGAK